MASRLAGRTAPVRCLGAAVLIAFNVNVAFAQGKPAPADTVIKEQIEKTFPIEPLLPDQAALKGFYAGRAFTPVWFDELGPTRAATQVIEEIEQAPTWGLRAQDFVFSRQVKGDWRRTTDEIAAADLELSRAVLRYAEQASGSRITEPERQLSDFIDRRPEMPDFEQVLNRITTSADPAAELRNLQPQHPQFQKLHALYVSLAGTASTSQPELPARGPILVPGASGPDVAILRQLLGVSAAARTANDVYDDALLTAVQAFQKSKGLSADGNIGPRTRKAFQKNNDNDKLQAIVASMEQWRWMPRDLGQRYALVNIPAFSISFVEGGKTELSERVIVGKPQTPTPVFSKAMSSIVLKPSWYLPDSIKREKLLAASRRGGSLEGEGLVVKKGSRTVKSWSVDWQKANLSQYAIYQPSGDGNALGDVKFLFPNKFSVYLHDTPNKSLFASSDRAYSHGCVRLRNPIKVAQFLLDWDQPGTFDAKRLSTRGPANNEITLQNPLPVHVGYFNVWVNDDGQAQYFGDPYGHAERIELALAGKWDAIDKGPRHDMDSNPGVIATNLSADNDSSRPKRSAAAAAAPGATAMGLLAVPAEKPKLFAPSKPHKQGYVSELMNSAFR